jgi:hypothetical protein
MTLRAPPFGRDVSATTQVHHGRVVSGTRLVAEAALRRLITERGSLQDDQSYGLPLSRWLGATMTEGDRLARAQQVRGELAKDPRLDRIDVVMREVRSGPSTHVVVEVTAATVAGGVSELAVASTGASWDGLRLEATT